MLIFQARLEDSQMRFDFRDIKCETEAMTVPFYAIFAQVHK